MLSGDNPDVAAALVALADKFLPFEQSQGKEEQAKVEQSHLQFSKKHRALSSPLILENMVKSTPEMTAEEEEEEEEEEEYDDSEETEDEEERDSEPFTSRQSVDPLELRFATSRELRKRKDEDDLWKPSNSYKKAKRQKLNSQMSSFGSMTEQEMISLPPKKKLPKIQKPETKLSFQEAAIRVMEEQQKKGKFALTTREIWDLIQNTGLVDTKCKTPVSSLSPQKTKPTHNREISPNVPSTVTNQVNGNNNNQPSPLKKTLLPTSPPVILATPSDLPSQPTNPKACWNTLPLAIKPHRIYYSNLTIGSHTYRIGDYAYFKPNSDSENPYVGKILKFWQTNNYSEKEKENQMFVKCVWYYYPEETHVGRTKQHHKKELFLSNLEDVNNVNSLISPLRVVTYPEFRKLNHPQKTDLKDVYFCRCSYFGETFVPFQVDELNGSVDIEMSEAIEECPMSWPQGLTYSSNLIFTDLDKDQFKEISYETESKVELQGQRSNSRSSPLKFTLVAKADIHPGCIVGEFSGLLRIISKQSSSPSESQISTGKGKVSSLLNPPPNSNSSSSSSISPSLIYEPHVLVLYEDESSYTVVDASKVGNEFRFLEDSYFSLQQPNVILSPFRKRDKHWNLFVISIAPIKKGTSLVADFSNVKKRKN